MNPYRIPSLDRTTRENFRRFFPPVLVIASFLGLAWSHERVRLQRDKATVVLEKVVAERDSARAGWTACAGNRSAWVADAGNVGDCLCEHGGVTITGSTIRGGDAVGGGQGGKVIIDGVRQP